MLTEYGCICICIDISPHMDIGIRIFRIQFTHIQRLDSKENKEILLLKLEKKKKKKVQNSPFEGRVGKEGR